MADFRSNSCNTLCVCRTLELASERGRDLNKFKTESEEQRMRGKERKICGWAPLGRWPHLVFALQLARFNERWQDPECQREQKMKGPI